MEATNVLSSKPIENESFWEQHYQSQRTSELSRTAYCRQHGLNYDRFGYWIGKFNRGHSDKLVSVKIKSESDSVAEPILCTLVLKNGHYLKIHDEQALTIILERYS